MSAFLRAFSHSGIIRQPSNFGHAESPSALLQSRFLLLSFSCLDNTVPNGATLKIGGTGTLPANYATHSIGATSTIDYSGTTQSVAALNSSQTYGNLTISGSGIKTLSDTVGVAGNLTVNGGTLDLGSNSADRTATGGTLTLASGAGLKIGGTGTLPSNYTTHSINAGSTVEYSGVAQTVTNPNSSQTYGTLILSGSGTKTLQTATATISGSLTLNGTASVTTVAGLTISGNLTVGSDAAFTVAEFNITVTGTTSVTGTFTHSSSTGAKTFTGNVTINDGGAWNESAAPAVSFGGSLLNNGTFTASTGVHTFTGAAPKTFSGTGPISIGSVTITGAYQNNGTLAIDTALAGAGSLTNGAAGTLNIGGTATITTLTATNVGNTVNYTGGTQTLKPTSYQHLGLSGGAKTLGAIGTIGGNLTLSGSATATTAANLTISGNLDVGSGTGFTVGANFTLGVTGTTAVSGTLTLAGTGAKTFTGNVAVNSGGTWSETGVAAYTIAGNLQNDGTFTASTGTHTFSGASKTLSGASTISIPNVTVTGSCANNGTLTVGTLLTVTSPGVLTNNGTITATTALSGTGTLIQGTSGVLNLGGTSGITGLTASANGNVVSYVGGAQTVKTISYDDLTIATSGVKTLAGNISVAGDLNVQAGTLDLATFTADRATVGGTLTVANGATLKIGGTGTLPANYATHSIDAASTIDYSGTTQSVAALSSSQSYGNLAISGSGIKTLSDSIGVAGNLTVNGGTFDLGSNNADRTTTGGTLTLAGGAGLKIGGTGTLPSNYTTHSINAASTVEYSGTTQTVTNPNSSQTYGNLILSGSGTKTLQTATTTISGSLMLNGTASVTTVAGLTISGNLAVGIDTAFTVAEFNITVTGTTSVTGTLTHSSNTGTNIFTGNVTINDGGVWNEAVAAAISFGGNLQNNGTFTAGTGVHTFTGAATKTFSGTDPISIESVTITGAYQNNGTLSIDTALSGAGSLVNGAAGTLNLGGTATITLLTATAVGNTVNYTGGAQILKVTPYHHLGLSGGAKTVGAIGTIGGNLTLSESATATTAANLTISGNLDVGSGTGFTVGANFTLAVTGTTAVTGTLTLAGTGAKTFTGNVTINSEGTWSETGVAAYTMAGNLQNDGTFTASTGVHTFSGASKTLSGASTISIPNVTVTGSRANNGTITVTVALSGAGTWTQGATGTLSIGGTSGITGLIATATGNVVNYNGGAQTLKVTAYHHLTLSGGAKTLGAIGTIGGNLTLSGSATATTGANLAIGENLDAGAGTTLTIASGFTLGVTGDSSVSGTLVLAGTGAKTFSGDVLINGGGVWNETGAAAYSFGGSLEVDGTFTANSGMHTFTGASETFGGTSGVSIASLTITGAYQNTGTLTIATALAGSGSLGNGASGTLNIGGTSTITTLTANTSGNTVNYNGDVQTVKAASYHHLTLSGTGAKTMTGVTTIGGNLAISGSATMTDNAGFTVQGTLNYSSSGSTTLTASTPISIGKFNLASGTFTDSGNTITVTGTGASTWTKSGTFVATGTVTFNGVAPQIGASNFKNLIIDSGSGNTATLTGEQTVSGSLNINSGVTLADGGFIITVNGNVANSGTHSGAGKILLTSASAAHTLSGSGNYANLELNDSNGASLTGSPKIIGVLTFTNGKITTDTNTLVIAATGSISGADTDKYVIGNLRRIFNAGSGQSFSFEIGDASNYTPASLTSVNVTTAGSVTASVTNAVEHPNIATSGLDSSKDVNRYWSLSGSDGIVISSCDTTFNFVAGDVDDGATTSNFVVRRYNNGWATTTAGTLAATSVQVTGLGSFGDFSIGEQLFDHYAVSAASPQTPGTPFNVTVAAQDILNQTVATDSATVVTLSGSGSVQFDGDGDGTFGDNSKMLSNGTFIISARDTVAETTTVTATSPGGKTGTSSGITIGSAIASKLIFVTSAVTVTAGIESGTITVRRVDQFNNPITAEASRAVTLSSDSTGTATFTPGSLTISNGSSSASFTYTDTKAGSPTITASTTSPTTIVSATQQETVSPAAASKLVFTTQPAGATPGSAFATQPIVKTRDSFDNDSVAGLGASLTVTWAINSGTGVLQGTLSGDIGTGAGNGTLSAGGLRIDQSGSFTLKAAADGLLTAVSSAFSIGTGAASKLVFTTASRTLTAGTNSETVTVQRQDSFSNPNTSDAAIVINLSTSSAGGVFRNTADDTVITTVTLGNGSSSVSFLYKDTVTGSPTVTVVSGGLASATQIETVNPSTASQVAFTTQPAGATAGAAFTTQPVVKTQDQFGNDSAIGLGTNVTVTLAIGTGTGILQGTVAGDIGTGGGNGTLNASGLRIDQAGSFALEATASGLTGGASSTFTVSAAIANKLAFTTQPVDATYGTNLAGIVVQIRDQFGNNVSQNGTSISMALNEMGTLGGTTTVTTESSGSATFSDLTVNRIGSKTLTASSTQLTSATSSAFTISAKSITVTAVVSTKTYDGAVASADIPAISGGLAFSDTANFTQSFNSRTVGTGKVLTPVGTVDDGNSGNNYSYTFVNSTAGVINARSLTATATGVNKVYDGTTSATVTLSDDRVSGDTLTASYTSAAFASKAAGTGKTVSVSGVSISGTDAGNYQIASTSITTTADITTRPITVTAVTGSKAYDGATTSSGTPTITAGTLATGDTAGFTQAYDNKNVGTSKTLTPSGSVNDGNSGNNYAVTFAGANGGVITAKSLAVSGVVARNKSYDGTTTATLNTTSAALVGVIDGDTVSLVTGSAAGIFADAAAGAGKAVTISGLSLSGADSGNYSLTQPTATADITVTSGTVTLANLIQTYDGSPKNATATTSPSGLTVNLTYNSSVVAPTDSGAYTVVGTIDDNNYQGSATGTLYIVPAVTSVSGPADGSYKAGDALDFTANYSGNVTVDTASGTPRMALTIGSTVRYASYISGSGSSALVFRYTVQTGETDSDGIALASPIALNGGSITDAAGNSAALSFTAPSTSQVLVDTTAPTISVSGPSAEITRSGPVTYTVSYADANFGGSTLSASDISLNRTGSANGVVNVTGSGTNYTVAISTITGDGTLGITIPTGIATDEAGNEAPAAVSSTFAVDNTQPGISISAPSISATRTGSVAYTVTYADTSGSGISAITLANSDVTLNKTGTANGSVTVTGSGTSTRTITISGITGNGTLGLSIASGSATDSAGNIAAVAGPSATVTVDNTVPTVSISAPSVTVTQSGSITYTVSYADLGGSGVNAVTLASTDITLNKTGTANGTLTVSGSGTAARTITISGITGDGTLGISVASGTATDIAGNTASSAGPSATTAVDNSAPAVSISAPSATFTKTASITYTVSYDDSDGSGISTIALAASHITLNKTGSADGTVAVSGTGATTRTVTISGISGDGTLGISIASGSASDLAGVPASGAGPSATFTVDNTAPTVTVGAPSSTITARGPVSYTITYADANFSSSILTAADVTLDATGSADGVVSVAGAGATRTVTISSITGTGTLGISLSAGTGSDLAGNSASSAGPSATFSVDNTVPTVSISAPSSSFAASGPVSYIVTYADTNFASSTLVSTNVTLNRNGTANGTVSVSGSGASRTVTISSITGNGTLGISIAAGTATDLAGNSAPASAASTAFTVDNTAPTVTIGSPSKSVTAGGPVTYAVTYNDANFNTSTLAAGGVSLNKTGTANGTVSVTGSGTNYVASISGITGDGTLGISIAAGTGSDLAGNAALASSASATFVVDNTSPSVEIGSPSADITAVGPVVYPVIYADGNFSASTLTAGNVTLVSSGTATGTVSVSGTGSTRAVTISSITGNGTLAISLAPGTASDTAGNLAPAAGPSASFTVDQSIPSVAIGSPSATLTTTGPVTYSVTFSDPTDSNFVLGALTTNSITLNATGTATGVVAVSGSGNIRTVTISSITGSGTLGVSVAAGVVVGSGGRASAAGGPSATFAVDNSAPAITISEPSSIFTGTGPVTYTVTYADDNFSASTLSAADVSLNSSGTATGSVSVTGSGKTRTVTISNITGNGTLGISLAAATATDLVGNSAAAAAASATFTVDNVQPAVSIGAPTASFTKSGPVSFAVTYSDTNFASSTLSAADVTLNATGTVTGAASVSGSGTNFTVTISSITGDGTLGISIGAGTATDQATNAAPAVGPSTAFIVDNTVPTLTIGDPSSSITANGPVTFEVSYSDSNPKASALTEADISLNRTGTADGTIEVTGSGTSYEVAITSISGDGLLSISIAAGTAEDQAGNTAPAVTSGTLIVDHTAPSVKIGTPSSAIASSGPVTYTVTYADDNFQPSTLSSSQINLRKTGTATADVSVSGTGEDRTVALSNITGNGTLGFIVEAGSAADLAGNPAPAAGPSATFVVDNIAPSITIGAPSSSFAKAGPVTYAVTYSDANFDVSTLTAADVTLNQTGTADGTLSLTGSGLSYTVTVSDITGEGSLGISIPGGTAADRAGNSAASATGVTFTVDNTPPAIAVSAPSSNITRGGPVTYTVTYSDATAITSTLTAADVSLNQTGTADGTVSVAGSGTNYTVTVSSITGDGSLGISIAAGTAADSSGNSALASDASATFSVDNSAPTVTIGPPSSSITKGGPVSYAITYADANFDAATLTAASVSLNQNGTATGTVTVTGSGTSYVATISGITGSGSLAISIPAGTAADLAGNSAAAAASATFVVDNTPPVITIGSPSSIYATGGPVTFAVNYADANFNASTLTAANVSLNATGTAAGTVSLTGSGTSYIAAVSSITGEGTIGISIAGGTASDLAGNLAPAANSATFTVDNSVPAPAISAPSSLYSQAGPVTYTVTYADVNFSACTLTAADITLNRTGSANGTVTVTGTGNTRAITVSSISGNGSLGVSIGQGTASDLAGNLAPAVGPSAAFTVDNTAPTVTIGSPSSTFASSGPVRYSVTYADSNFNAGSLTAGAITLNKTGSASGVLSVAGSGTNYTVTISSITGNGTLGISLAAGTATDLAANSAPAAGPSATFVVDNTSPSVVISAPSSSFASTGPVSYTVTYNEANLSASSLVGADIILNRTGTASGTVSVTGGGMSYQVAISNITGNGTLGVSVASETAADLAGNLATAAGPSATFVVDNAAPAIVISAPSASRTSSQAVSYTITYSDANMNAVTLTAGGVVLNKTGTASGVASVSGSGSSRTVTLSNIAGEGVLGISLVAGTASDLAGNPAAAAGPSATFAVDNAPPSAPVVSAIHSDTGAAGSDGITSDKTLILSGTAEAGSTVTITRNHTGVIGTAVADESGAWSFDYTGTVLADGSYSFTATATDAVGNVSVASAPFAVTVDSVAPNAPIFESISEDTGRSSSDRITRDTALFLTGTAEAGSTVALSRSGSGFIGTTVANADGDWSFDYTGTALSSGNHTFTATATDVAGNLSAVSASFAVTIDTEPPQAPSVPHLSASSDTGISNADALTSVNRPVFTGTAEALAIVELFLNGTTSLGTVTAGADGSWSLTSPSLADGTYSITAKATDGAGNQSAASTALNVTVDTTPPTISDIANQTIQEDNATSAIVFSVADSRTAASALALAVTSSNTNLVPDDHAVFSGAGTDRTITITPASQQFGVSTITVTVTDLAGISASDSFTVTVMPVADTPLVTNATTIEDRQTTDGLIISRNPVDGNEVTHFKITSITQGMLYQSDGTTPIADGTFITFAQGHAGLKFTPSINSEINGSFCVQASTSALDSGLGGSIVTATITVITENDAPLLAAASPALTTINEDQTENSGQTVASIVGAAITDPDTSAAQGIAVTTMNSGNGRWQYSLNNGSSWSDVGTVSDGNALLLEPASRVRFLPDGKNGTSASLTYRAWDQTSGTAGAKADASSNGGVTAFSTATDIVSIIVTAVNDAPVLTAMSPTLATITEDQTNNSGQTVASILGTSVADVDSGAVQGMAVTAVNSSNGRWQFSLDSGGSWSDVEAVSVSGALLLGASDWIRFVPDGKNGTSASLTYQAWDTTSGVEGALADASINGGITSFSTGVDTAAITIVPVNDAPMAANVIPDQSGVYGASFSYTIAANIFSDLDADDTLTYLASGLPPGLSFNSATRVISGILRAAGIYPVTITGTDLGNAHADATFIMTVAKAALTVTAEDKTKVYGAALPALTANYSGLTNNDTPADMNLQLVLSTTGSVASEVGTYPITANGDSAANYTISYVPGTLTVIQAPLTITAEDKSKTYGSSVPALTAAYSGFVNGDTAQSLDAQPQLTTTTTSASAVGNYPIVAQGAVDANYAITYVNGVMKVLPAELIVTPKDVGRGVNLANPPLTGTIQGLKNNDPISAVYSTAATIDSPVGTYPITASLVDPAGKLSNYSITLREGTLSVRLGTSFAGVAQDGYISNGTVFFDANKNGIRDGDEPSAVTDSKGAFDLSIHVSLFDLNGNGVLDPSEGIMRLVGGVDIATGMPLQTPLSAPPGATVVTPLTTLLATTIENNPGLTVDESKAKLNQSLGIPANVDLVNYDPIAGAVANDSVAVGILNASAKVQDTLVQISSLMSPRTSDDKAQVAAATMNILANQIAAGNSLQLSQSSNVKDLLASVADTLGKTISTSVVDGVAEIIAGGNQVKDQIVANGGGALEVAQDLTRAQVVSQAVVATTVAQVAVGATTVAQAVSQSTGTALQQTLAAIPIIDIQGQDERPGTFSFNQPSFETSTSGTIANIVLKRVDGNFGDVDLVVSLKNGTGAVAASVPVRFGSHELIKNVDLLSAISGTPQLSQQEIVALTLTLSANAPIDSLLGTQTTATLTVHIPPSLVIQPGSRNIPRNGNVTFVVAASGTPKPGYQWQKNGINLSGKTEATLSLNGVTDADAGNYRVIVSNVAGTVISQTAVLTIVPPPAILRTPRDQTISAGSKLLLEVEAIGVGPFSYHWSKDGAIIPGATGSTFSLSNATEVDSGMYQAAVANEAGETPTVPVQVKVYRPVTFPVQPVPRTVNVGANVDLIAKADGTGALRYRWFKNGNAISGATLDSLSLRGVEKADAGDYYLEVSSPYSTNVSISVPLVVNWPPTIKVQPRDQRVLAGNALELSVEAEGDQTLEYQWFKDDIALTGANAPVFTIAAASTNNSGIYRANVRNGFGSATSASAKIVVLAPPIILEQPKVLGVTEGTNAIFHVTVSGSLPFRFQWYKNGVEIPGAISPDYAIAQAQAGDAGDYSVSISNDAGGILSAVAALIVSPPKPVSAELRLIQTYNPQTRKLEFQIQGQAGQRFEVQQSTDLLHWSAIQTGVLTTNTSFSVTTDGSSGFFRIRSLPAVETTM